MTIGSLFDGSGTAPLAATLLGGTPLWASEIEPYPIAVTRARFPQMKHLGNITEIDGAAIEPVDIIVGGSPCQDLSVAGKQAGLENGTRSNMFYEMTRIVREMRGATNGEYPRFVVWENVPGAFSSNKGKDFLSVVEAFCALADNDVHIPRPAEDKTGRLTWANAGAVVGDGWSFAWRVLDAQFWGVPQRRRRIFAVLDFTGEHAGEILFERTRLPWDSEPRGEAWQGAPADAVGRADRSGGVRCLNPWDCQSKRIFEIDGIYPILPAMDGGGANNQAVIYPAGVVGSLCVRADSSPCVDRGQPFVAMFSGGQGEKAGSIGYSEDAAPTLRSTLAGGNAIPQTVYALQGNGIDRSVGARCNGCGWREGEMYTLNTVDRPAVCYESHQFGGWREGCGALRAAGGDNGGGSENLAVIYDARGNGDGEITPTLTGDHQNRVTDYTALCVDKGKPPRRYIVRRLTPTECARLQGFPDWWVDGIAVPNPTDEDIAFWAEVWETHRKVMNPDGKPKTRKQIVTWLRNPGSDSNEYKMWGNGMALPCMLAVLNGIREAM